PEIARAPFGIGLEAAAGKHHRAGGKLRALAIALRTHAGDALAVVDQFGRASVVADPDAGLGGRLVERAHEAGATSGNLDRQAAEEPALAVHEGRLPPEIRHEAHAL